MLLDRLMKSRKVDTVMHFAGSVVVPDSVADPLGYYLNNTVKSRELIAAAVSNGVEKFVFSSTSAVYGVPEKVPVSEDTPLNPMSPYGASKAMTERMLTDSARRLRAPLRGAPLFQRRRRRSRWAAPGNRRAARRTS